MEGQEGGETDYCSLKGCRTYKDTQPLQLVKKMKASQGRTIEHMVGKCVYIENKTYYGVILFQYKKFHRSINVPQHIRNTPSDHCICF